MQMDWPARRQMLHRREHGRPLMKSTGAQSCVKQRRARVWQTISPGTLQTFVLGTGFNLSLEDVTLLPERTKQSLWSSTF